MKGGFPASSCQTQDMEECDVSPSTPHTCVHQGSISLTRAIQCLGLQDVFVDDQSYHAGHGEAYAKYGVDAAVGAVVLVRPDQCK